LQAFSGLTRYLYLDRFRLVVRDRGFSAQTLSVLAVLCARPEVWHHGYDIARETGLKSGTLYPILIRLADRGLLDACWEDEQPAGRPRRHLYQLTSEGLARASQALAEAHAPARTPRKPRRAVGQIAPEGM
jgi:DNA-binding PadR family transcriptional regulator